MPTKYSMPKLAVAIAAMIALTGCKDAMEQLNRDLAAANAAMAGSSTLSKPGTMARMDTSVQQQKTQLIVPKDQKVEEAVDAALPTIKKVLAVHQCARSDDALLPLNRLAITGVNIPATSYGWGYPLQSTYFKYHDMTKCLGIHSIDEFSMLALNALRFRVVYFAEDSGETVNFWFLFKKADDGTWRIAAAPRTRKD